jgi:hypothetical protein
MYFFFRRQNYFYWAIAGLLFCASMYTYPAMRLQVPIMLVTLWLYSLKTMKTSFSLWLVFAISFILPLLPLVVEIFQGSTVQHRFNQISIAAPEYLKAMGKTNSLKDLWDLFWTNYQLHLSPDFLFFKGDPSLVHSVGHFGILSWLDMGALTLCVIYFLMLFIKPLRSYSPWLKDYLFLTLLLSNIFLGIIPSALTNSEIPHALRVDGGWPFMCLLSGYVIYQLWNWCKPMLIVAIMVGIFYLYSFSKIYFGPYQEESKGMFSYWTKDQADAARTEEDWAKFKFIYQGQDYHFRYYLMHYKHQTCTATRIEWEKQRELLARLGLNR